MASKVVIGATMTPITTFRHSLTHTGINSTVKCRFQFVEERSRTPLFAKCIEDICAQKFRRIPTNCTCAEGLFNEHSRAYHPWKKTTRTSTKLVLPASVTR